MTNTLKQIKKEIGHWYAVQTQSSCEEAVARYLKQRIESLEVDHKIFNVIVPKEKKVKIKNNKRILVEEKIYPGYVLVEMIMGPDTWYIVRNTPRVIGFIGADRTKPAPLSKEEIDLLMIRMSDGEPTLKCDLKIGDLVRVTDGSFKDVEGKIGEIDETKGRVKVLVSIFGRDTAVEIDILQVKKV
ncbi:MAG: transcription termination/antitermination protein NusG [Candidatus Liptonbacteria bacterium]|nr:transcription termination/antitermination protein NusG [Candidatus Liptonbacteria bacterium]